MKMRSETQPSPEELRELAALDAALAGEPVDPALAELEQLVVSLREERPVARREFAAELDARAAAGFATPEAEAEPGRDRRGALARLNLSRRAVPLALGTAASVFIVAVAVVSAGLLSGDGGSNGKQERVRDVVRAGTTPSAAPAPPAAAGGGAIGAPETADLAAPRVSPSPPQGGVAPRRRERKQEREASLVLGAAAGDVEDVADDVIEVTDRYRGFVLSSTVTGADKERAGASLELRIPSNRLQAAIGDLSKLAHVRSRNHSTQDVTARFVSLRAGLQEALAERKGLLRQLARADTPNETASIRARLLLANRRIARARARLRSQSERIDFAAVSVTVEAEAGSGGGDGKWTIGDAIGDAGRILATAAAIALVTLAVGLPLTLVALVAWFAARRAVQGRRERALDAPERFEKSPAQ
jgi:hypothetical protein